MQTVYDWVTIAIFAGLIVVFLQRSVAHGEGQPDDPMWRYLPPAIGLAVANYFGNEGQGLVAWLIIAGVIAYTIFVLRPFPFAR